MTNALSRDLPPPRNWQDFERLSFDVYRRLWRTSDAQLHGRTGQPQSGVDVYGTDRVEGRYVGVQCKGKDANYGGVMTERELRNEVAKALTFQPPLDVFVLVTTAPNDAVIQAMARSITADHRATGAFEVQVTGWDTFRQYVTDFPEVLDKHFRDLAPVDPMGFLAEAHGETRSTLMRLETQIAMQTRLMASKDSGETGDPLAQRITDAARLTGEGSPRTALKALRRLLDEHGEAATPLSRYRLLANIGNAEFVLGREDDAMSSFRRAYDAFPEHPNARATMAIVELAADDRERSHDLASAALRDDPGSERAAGVLIDAMPPDASTADVAAMMPPELSGSAEVELHLSLRATRIGEEEAALRHAERALELAPDDWRTRSAVAEALIHPLSKHDGLALTHALTPVMRSDVERAIGLSRAAWTTLASGESSHVGRHVAVNLMGLCELVGREDEAEAVLDEALAQNPEFGLLLRRRAQIAAARGEWREARSFLERMRPEDVSFDDLLVATQAALRLGDAAAAVTSAARLSEAARAPDQAEFAEALAGEAAVLEGADPVRTRHAVLDVRPGSIVLRSLMLDFLHADDPLRGRIADEVKQLAGSVLDARSRLHAAETMFDAGLHSLAADLLEPLHDLNDSYPLRRRLEALHLAGRRVEARALFEALKPDLRRRDRYAPIGVAIYERAGLLRPALQLVEDVLRGHDVLRNRLSWMQFLIRQDRSEEILPWLREVAADIPGTAVELMGLAHLLDRYLPGDAKALAVGYRALRAGYGDPDIHLAYAIGLFINGSVDRTALASPAVVEAETGVVLRNRRTGERLHLQIETGDDPRPERGELGIRDALARRLVGKRPGEMVELDRIGAAPDQHVVEEVQSRFVFAFQRTLRDFPRLFPGHSAFGSIDIGEEGEEGRFEPIFAMARERARQAAELVSLYRKSVVPLPMLSRFAGASVFDLWDGLAWGADGGLKVAQGVEDEFRSGRVAAGAGLAVVDPLSIYGWVRTGLAEAVAPLRHRLAVVQSTIDMLRGLLAEWEAKRGRRTGSFGWDGEHYRMVELTDGTVDGRAAEVEAMVRLAESLRLVPAEADRPLREDVAELLGDGHPAFRDTLLAGAREGRCVLSDDLGFRVIAQEAGAAATWTQPFLQRWTGAEGLSRAGYRTALHRMIAAGYEFTQFGHVELVEELRESGWSLSDRLEVLADRLSRANVSGDSVALVMAQLILASAPEAPTDEAFAMLPRAVADRIAEGRSAAARDELFRTAFGLVVVTLVRQLNRARLRGKLLDTTRLHPPSLLAREHVDPADRFARRLWSRLREAGLDVAAPGRPRFALPSGAMNDAGSIDRRLDHRRRKGLKRLGGR